MKYLSNHTAAQETITSHDDNNTNNNNISKYNANNNLNSNNNPSANFEDNNDDNKDGNVTSVSIFSNSNANNAPPKRKNIGNVMRLPIFISHPNRTTLRVLNQQKSTSS